MNFESIVRSPWFYSSPGPISLAYYGTITIVGAYLLTQRIQYKKRKWLLALTDSFFLNGFIILSGDLIWIGICAVRFLPSYPDSLFQVVSVLGRDVVGMVLCYFLVGNLIKKGIIKFGKNTLYAYLLLIGFLLVDFGMAANPTWTDWTYAVRQGCSTNYILASLLFSYGIGKVLSALLVYTWWKKD